MNPWVMVKLLMHSGYLYNLHEYVWPPPLVLPLCPFVTLECKYIEGKDFMSLYFL